MKFNKTFKKSISIILTIIMILSTFGSAIVPAGAADTSENTSSADTYYFWYGDANVLGNSASHINDWKQDANRITMTTGDDGNTYYCEYPLTKDKDLFFVINTSDSSAANNTVIWKSNDAVKNNLSYASGVNKNRDFYIQNYTVGSTQYYYPNIGVASNQKLRFTFTPSTNKVVVSPAGGSQEETTAPTNPPTGNVYVYFDNTYYKWNSVYAYVYDESGQPVVNNGTWPGKAMELVSGNLYRYQVPANLANGQVIFNNNNGSQYPGQNQAGLSIGGSSHKLSTNNVWEEYTPEVPTDPTDPTNPSETTGAYKIEDATLINGSLTLKADGKKSGTADEGDIVSITANPKTAYSLVEITAIYEDANGDEHEVTVTNNQFVMPAADVEFVATFTIDKNVYIESLHEDGLWFDAAPDMNGTSATLVKWNNYTGREHTTDGNPYTLYIPRDVDLSSVVLYNGYDNPLTINGTTIPANGHATVSLAETTYTTSGATSKSVKVMQGSTDSIYFHTTKKGNDYSLPTSINDSRATTSKGSIKTDGGACVTINSTSVSKAMPLDSIKGRGNSSWKASKEVFGKYAYNMKLDSATTLLGLPKSKSFCLLANNADESMLRNALTYDLAAKVGLYDSPEFKFVDMYDNGEYHGTYFICEKVDVASKNKLIKGESFDDINEEEIGKDVIDAAAEDKNNYKETTYSFNNQSHRMQYLKTGNNNTTGVPYNTRGTYLLEFEIEERYDDEIAWFVSPKGQEVVVKSPENATEEQVRYIAQKFAEMEAVVYNSASTLDNMKNHIDVDSFAKMYLIQELSSNLDSAATSYYITFDCSKGADTRFVASPVWDYDWAYGQYDSTTAYRRYDKYGNEIFTSQEEGWFAKNKAMGDGRSSTVGKRNLQGELASHSAFQPVIKKAWNNGFYSNVQTYYNTTLDNWKNQIADSMKMNENRWHFIANDNASSWGSKNTGANLTEAVIFLENWLTNRSAWLNTEIQKYGNLVEETVQVPNVVNKTQDEAVTLLENAGLKYSVVEVYNDAAKGTVISSDPSAGETVAKGSIVKITVSLGQKPMVTVPDVVGENKANAITQLEALGLVVKVTTQSNDTVDAGIVISSTPGKDASVEPGSTVTIVVSTGPVETVTINNVKIMFKGTNLKNLTPKFTFNGETVEISRVSRENDGYIGTYFTGAYGFYWWEATLDSVTVGEDNVLKFTTTGSDMNASLTYDFARCESECELYFAVDNMYSGTELVNITGNNTARFTFRSAGNMVSNANYAEDPTPSRVMLSLLDAAGVATTKAYTVGDTNADGNVNIKDATLAQMMTAGIVSGSDTNNLLGDYDISGDVNIKDATGIQSYIVNY